MRTVRLTRRDFMKMVIASAVALGLSRYDLINIDKALAAATSPPVIWLQASGCTGCSVSLLNYIDVATGREIDEVLLEDISLKYHPTPMAAAGDLAIATAKEARDLNANNFVLVVEGAVPTGIDGNYCHMWKEAGVPYTAKQAVLDFGAKAKHILAVGTCAGFGGIPSGGTNPTTAVGLLDILPRADDAKVINLAGCPSHPDWMLGTIVKLILGQAIPLDANKRPTQYYGNSIHPCYRSARPKASDIGQLGCMLVVGCRKDCCDSPTRLWNNGTNWCVRANTPCIGCVSPSFPGSSFYKV